MIHGLHISKEWPHGQRGKAAYRAGCKCGWREDHTVALRYVAEQEFKEHRDQQKVEDRA